MEYLSFSAHADAKGIMQLIRQVEPLNVMLVHGEAKKMDFLRQQIKQHYGKDSFAPPNGKTEIISCPLRLSIDLSVHYLTKRYQENAALALQLKRPCVQNIIPLQGVLILKEGSMQMFDQNETRAESGITYHELKFQHILEFEMSPKISLKNCVDQIYLLISNNVPKYTPIQRIKNTLIISSSSLSLQFCENDNVNRRPTCSVEISWSFQDEELGNEIILLLKKNESILKGEY